MDNDKDKQLLEICQKNGHLICESKMSDNIHAVSSMPQGLFTNCQWISYFGLNRFTFGWFRDYEVADFLSYHGFGLEIYYNDSVEPYRYVCLKDLLSLQLHNKFIVIKLKQDINWSDGKLGVHRYNLNELMFSYYNLIHRRNTVFKVINRLKEIVKEEWFDAPEALSGISDSLVVTQFQTEIGSLNLDLKDYDFDDSDDEEIVEDKSLCDNVEKGLSTVVESFQNEIGSLSLDLANYDDDDEDEVDTETNSEKNSEELQRSILNEGVGNVVTSFQNEIGSLDLNLMDYDDDDEEDDEMIETDEADDAKLPPIEGNNRVITSFQNQIGSLDLNLADYDDNDETDDEDDCVDKKVESPPDNNIVVSFQSQIGSLELNLTDYDDKDDESDDNNDRPSNNNDIVTSFENQIGSLDLNLADYGDGNDESSSDNETGFNVEEQSIRRTVGIDHTTPLFQPQTEPLCLNSETLNNEVIELSQISQPNNNIRQGGIEEGNIAELTEKEQIELEKKLDFDDLYEPEDVIKPKLHFKDRDSGILFNYNDNFVLKKLNNLRAPFKLSGDVTNEIDQIRFQQLIKKQEMENKGKEWSEIVEEDLEQGQNSSYNKGNNNIAEESAIFIEYLDVNDDCCLVPELVTDQNFSQMAGLYSKERNQYNQSICLTPGLLHQFNNTFPNIDCLINMMEICDKYLEFMNNTIQGSKSQIYFVKVFTHFRHDVFSYIFSNYVLKLDVKFGTDQPFPLIHSSRTPDLIIMNQDHKSVKIYEFTVVMNALTANFLKGFDSQTSKYKQEIKQYSDLGYNVEYYPIFMSMSASIEINIDVWSNLGFEISDEAVKILERFKNSYNIEYNYLLSFGFMDQQSRTFPESDKFINSLNPQVENPWCFKIVSSNKRNLYKLIKIVKEKQFDDDVDYVLKSKSSDTGKLFFLNKARKNEKNKVKGFLLNKYKNDDLSIYNLFKYQLNGREKCLLKTKISLNLNNDFVPKHGKFIQFQATDSKELILNNKNINIYSFDESNTIDKILMNNQMNDLNKRNTGDLIDKALQLFKLDLVKWKTPQNVGVPVLNKPRRSFIALIDTEMTSDITYKDGLCFNALDLSSIKSNVAKHLISRAGELDFTQNPSTGDINLLQVYKNASGDYYSFIKENGLESTKPRYIEGLLKIKSESLVLAYKNKKEQMRNAQNNYTKTIDSKKGKSFYLTIDDYYKNLYKNETNWTSNSGYKLYMGNAKDLTLLFENLKFKTKTIHFRFEKPMNTFDSHFFKDLKDISLEELSNETNYLMTTKLFQKMVFLSRLAYTLSSVSNKTFNGKKFHLDNLGLTNVILIVKGGKKISSTRKTKIFKLIYPCEKFTDDWNPTTFMSNGNYFDETPWMQLHQETLFDLIAAPYKLLCNFSYLAENHSYDESFDILSLPSLLLIHNRRKTEQLLHNMRYLCVNPLAEMSQVDKMLSEFGGPSYTALDYSIKHGLYNNYKSYYQSIRQWSELRSNEISSFTAVTVYHPYLNRKINSIVDFTYIVYSTYLMSKGHYEQSLEQVNNLKSIMETHETYENSGHSIVDINEPGGIEKIKVNDFSFSPQVAYNIGKVLTAELKSKHAVNHMAINWNNLLNSPIDIMANNRGLRSQGKDFFGHKGYFVIYKQIFDSQFEELAEILKTDDLIQIHKKLRDLNCTFEKAQSRTDLKKVVFHVVDKSQRGGGREIYVMDYVTKLYQHPIEKMFKYICGFIDNEIISVPSAQRAGLIHKKCFEFTSEKYTTYYMSYDCRKWAPRSNPEKYLYMILGMREVLPDDFVKSVIHYFLKHKNKQISTRIQIKEKFLSNPDNHKYRKFFKDDEEEDRSYFLMPYSFVMGIFNMLSSLFHAGAQTYFAYLLERPYLENNTPIDFNMYAHSDDSGGRLSVYKKGFTGKDLDQFVGKYEFMMKTANHLMSVKKCSTSKVYFELLSVLYVNAELLPLLSKFLGNIKLNFSGQGISSDMKTVISKSIELQTNGATANLAYKCQIYLSNMFRNFYRINIDTQIPAFGGFVNSWPTLYTIYGSATDEIRSSIYNYELYSKIMTFAVDNLDYEIQDGTLNLKFQNVIRAPKAYKDFKSKIQLPEFPDSQWFFEQNKTHNTALNLLWFRANLESKNFSTAVLNINDIKRALDSFYMASGSHIQGKYNLYNIRDMLTLITETEARITKYESILKVMYKPLRDLFFFTDDLERIKMRSKTRFTTKPCTLSLNQFVESPITNYNSLQLAVQICRPELFKYLFSNKRYGNELNTMKKYLESLGVKSDIIPMKNFLDYMAKTRNKVINFYAELPANSRSLIGNDGCFEMIKACAHSNLQIINHYSPFILDKDIDMTLNDEIKMIINSYYFYAIYLRTRNDHLAMIPLNSTFTKGKHITVNNIPNFVAKNIPYPELMPFLEYLERTEPFPIILSNLTNWSIWTKRQGRVGDSWVGSGNFDICLDNKIFNLEVINDQIVSLKHNETEPIQFTNCAAEYFSMICKEFKINSTQTIIPEEDKLYFGFNSQSQLGLHKGTNILFGVQETILSRQMDLAIYYKPLYHNYANGKHYVEIKHINYHIYTFDELCFKNSKKTIFDIVNWETIDKYSKNIFMKAIFSGEFGTIDEVNFDKFELIENFLATDIYRMFYNSQRKQVSLSQAFWDDILQHVTYEEDIFPTLYENLGLAELEKILPRNKKDNVALYLYFDKMDDQIPLFRRKLLSIDNNDERIKYLSEVMLSMGDVNGIIALPEIGDEEEFSKFKFDKLEAVHWFNFINVFCNALLEGYDNLSLSSKKSLSVLNSSNLKNTDSLLYEFYRHVLNNNVEMADYQALTHNQMWIHHMLYLIFEEKSALAEFSRALRGTIAKNIPRHPKYQDDWQTVLANAFKFVITNKFKLDSQSLSPASSVRIDKFQTEYPGCRDLNLGDRLTMLPCIPPSLRIHMETDALENLEATFYKSVNGRKLLKTRPIKDNDLNKLIFKNQKITELKGLWESYLDDVNIINPFYRRKKTGMQFVDARNPCDLVNFCNKQISNLNYAVITTLFNPYHECRMLEFIDKRGSDTKLYVYNLNENSDLPSKKVPIKFKTYFDRYIDYYDEVVDNRLEFEKIADLTHIKIDFNTQPSIEIIKQRFDIEDNESYNEELIKYLSEKFDLTDDDIQKVVRPIFNMNISAIGKYTRLRKSIQDLNKHKDSEMDFDKLVKEVLKDMKTVDIKISGGVDRKINLGKTTNSPNELIMQLSSYKKEFQQGNTILNYKWGELLTDKLILSNKVKEHLTNNFIFLYKNLKKEKLKHEASVCKFVLDVLKTATIGQENDKSKIFDEDMRQLMNELVKRVNKDEDEDELFEPMSIQLEWEYIKRNK